MRKKTAVLIALTLLVLAVPAFAQEPAAPAGAARSWGAGALGAAFLLGIAAAFGAMAQGRATSAAAEGMSRNPGAAGPIRTMTIIGIRERHLSDFGCTAAHELAHLASQSLRSYSVPLGSEGFACWAAARLRPARRGQYPWSRV